MISQKLISIDSLSQLLKSHNIFNFTINYYQGIDIPFNIKDDFFLNIMGSDCVECLPRAYVNDYETVSVALLKGNRLCYLEGSLFCHNAIGNVDFDRLNGLIKYIKEIL